MTIAIADKKKTIFMQACGVFERFKVVFGTVACFDSNLTSQQVFDILKESGEIPICVLGETDVLNGSIKSVSDGDRWATIEKFTETLKQDKW